MANKLYVPMGGLSDNVTKIYVPVNGLSNNVVKGYCSVGGLSKLFFGSGGSNTGFWFYYATNQAKIIDGKRNQVAVEVDRYFQTTGLSFYFIVYFNDTTYVITLSTDSYCGGIIAEYEGSSHYWMTQYNYTINGDKWYYAIGTPLVYSGEPSFPNDFSPNCKVPNTIWEQIDDIYDIVTKRILPKLIYADDFAEDYQVGQTYNVVFGNMEKTVRKALAIWLFKNITLNSYNAYKTLLTNFETIVTRIMNEVTTQKGINIFIYAWVNGSVNQILITVGYGDNQSNTFTLNQSSTSEGYKCLSYSGSWIITESKRFSVNINDTSITYNSSLSPQGSGQIGVDITTAPSAITGKKVSLTNLGLKFA